MQKNSAKQGPRFFKLHGAGNDLLVLKRQDLPSRNKAAFVRRICHRQLGLGSDQLIEIISLRPLSIQVWNQDGSQAEMCANGSRTFLFLAALQGWVSRRAESVRVKISGKNYEGLRIKPGNYELCLGQPDLEGLEVLRLGKERIPFYSVRTGNPHAVIWMAGGEGNWRAPEDFQYTSYGSRIEVHSRFPRRTNVEFVRRLRIKGKRAEVYVEAWERGAGATLSCGSGAVAVAAEVRRRTGAEVIYVKMTKFKLRIRFEGDRAFLSGPCALVASGFYVG